jgi:predicted amidohydrolase
VRVAIIQTDPVFGEISSNVAAALKLMHGLSADLYVLPELFNTGYNFTDRAEAERLSESTTGPTYQSMAAFAAKNNCFVAYGFAEKDKLTYNSCALVGPAGLVGLYRKVHLYYRETLLFAPGDRGFPVFDLPFGRVGMMICFDWMYPESARTLALKGAQLIIHPSNLVMPYCPDAMVTRCLENRVFAATADRVGRENRGGVDLRYIGMSEVVSPRGEILRRLGNEQACAAVVEIDLSLASNKKINEFNDLVAGRRPEQYRFVL